MISNWIKQTNLKSFSGKVYFTPEEEVMQARKREGFGYHLYEIVVQEKTKFTRM